jgi:predicted nucleotidyltransferase
LNEILKSKQLSRDQILSALTVTIDDIVFLSGSLFQGYGNARSDIDVFIISAENREYFQQMLQVAGEDIDYEIWNYDIVKDIIKRINSIDFEDPDFRVLSIKDDEKELVFRILVGEAIQNEHIFKRIQESINQDQLKLLTKRFYINLYDNLFEDAFGAMESEDFTTAYFRSLELLQCAMKVYLADYGELGNRLKWLPRAINRWLGDSDIISIKYFDFFFRPISISGIPNFLVEVFDYCELLISEN